MTVIREKVVTQKFNSSTNELEIFGKTLTVELSGNYFFYPRKILRGPCVAIGEHGVFCCNDGKVCTELPLTEENLNYALVELRRKCWDKIMRVMLDL
jgi:hypothetical protein